MTQPTGNDKRRANKLLVWGMAILATVTLGARVYELRETIGRTTVNVPLLKAAVPALPGVPDTDWAGGDEPVSGLQARALAHIFASNGQTAEAEYWLAQGLVDRPSLYLTEFELCRLYWREGQRDRALDACRGTKSSAQYWMNQGYMADFGRNPQEALAYYEMAGVTDPEMIVAWHHVGRVLFALKRYEEAIAAYERVMALDVTPAADVYDSLSLSYLQAGNLPMARDVLNRGLMIYPSQREYYLGMADTFRAEDDLDTADSWYARMLQRWPYDAQAWSARGDVAAQSGRLEDAIAYYQEAAANQPEGVGYWMNLASTAAAMGDVPLATESYQKALALRPDDPAIWLHAGRFLVDTEQVDEARTVFEHILVLQPDNGEAATQLAEMNNPGSP